MSREFEGTSYYDWPGWGYSTNPCFACWAQLGSGGGRRGIVGKKGVSNLFDTWAALYVNSSDKLVFHVSNGAGVDVASAASVATGAWTLLGGQYDGEDLTVWIDGVQDGATNAPGMSLAAGGSPYVGFLDDCLPWLGLLENVAYWGRGLTEEEWASLYEGTSPGRLNFFDPISNPGLRSHWPLWGQYSDEPSVASDDVLLENGSLGGADPSERVGSPWSVAG